MVQEVNNNTYQFPSTIDELVDVMELYPFKYKHLQFILNRKKHNNLGLGQKYLVVTPAGFGLYELISVDYSIGILKMMFTTPDTGIPAKINLDVRNKHPETYLINWKDIEDIVLTGRNLNCADGELLELDDDE